MALLKVYDVTKKQPDDFAVISDTDDLPFD